MVKLGFTLHSDSSWRSILGQRVVGRRTPLWMSWFITLTVYTWPKL